MYRILLAILLFMCAVPCFGAQYFANIGTGASGNDGLQSVALPTDKTDLTWAYVGDGTTGAITLHADDYALVAVGDILYLYQDGGGATKGWYTVTSKDGSNKCTLTFLDGTKQAATPVDLTATGPEDTIARAIADATSGGTINVAPGTYAETLAINSAESSDSFTVKKYGTGTCKIEVNNALPLQFGADFDTGTFVWDGIDIISTSATTTGNVVRFLDNTCTANHTFKNCTLRYDASKRAMMHMEGVNGVGRNITLDNVVMTAPIGSWIFADAYNNLIVKNCIWTHSSTASTDLTAIITIGGSASAVCKNTEFYSCSFTSAIVSATHPIFLTQTTTSGVITIRDCGISLTGLGFREVGTATTGTNVRIFNNTWYAVPNHVPTAFNVIMIGTDADVSANVAGSVFIVNNTFTSNGPIAETSNLGFVYLGPESRCSVVADNNMTGQCLIGADATASIGVYSRHADNTVIRNNSIACAIPIAVTEAENIDIIGNSLYTTIRDSHGCITLRDSNAGRTSHTNAAGGNWRADPVNIVVTRNVCQSTASHCLFVQSHLDGARTMVKDRWFIDRNIYYKTGTAAVASIDTADKTLDTLKTFWQAGAVTTDGTTGFSDIATVAFNAVNDLRSSSANPQFFNVATGDMRLRSGSPARGVTYGPWGSLTLDAWNDLGAWRTEDVVDSMYMNPNIGPR